MPSVELIAIGTEILLGHLVDTNTTYIASRLADAAIDVYAKHAVGDNADRLATMLEGVLARADGAVTTGGLGPTVDDLTKDAVGRVVGEPLELHEASLRAIEERFKQFGRPMTENNRRQAYLPRNAVVLENPHGTAPGFVAFRADGKFVACMPGVPREMRPMLQERLLPLLRERYQLRGGIFTRTLHTVGMGESQLDSLIEDLFRTLENPKIAVLAHGGRVDVKVSAKADDERAATAMIAPVAAELRRRIGHEAFYGEDATTLPGAIVAALTGRGLTIGTAESCTGGGVAQSIVSVPGASATFRGTIVAYANDVKRDRLEVREETLARFGAVSERTAVEMARGAQRVLGVDWALATTGIAGPDGGSVEKPVGLVWFALADHSGNTQAWRRTFPGERTDIQDRAVTAALALVWRHLERDVAGPENV